MKILFVRINEKIGDTVIETFFYRELKRLYPGAHLAVMCCGDQAILNEIPYIDELILLPPLGVRKQAAAFAKLPFLWKQNYDLLISFTPHWRMKVLNTFIRARRKECFDLIPGEHVSAAYAQVLKRLGMPAPDTSYELRIPARAQQAVLEFLEKNSLAGKPFLFFNPAGGDVNRTLTPARVREILSHLGGGMPVVLCNYHNAYAACGAVAVLWNSGDILQTAALVEKSAYVLSVDTGISHLAEVFNKPMTVLFSLKNYANEPAKDLTLLTTWAPRGPRVQKLHTPQNVNEIPSEDILKTLGQNWAQKK